MNQQFTFRPRARLLLQLGDQLIRNESIAVLEIIKNAYDADASKVKIWMADVTDKNQGRIVIEDDGAGMDLDLIRDVWMQPGSDYKKKLFDDRKKSPKFGRLPLGEKGIGRFGVHKLGARIELISKKQGRKEVLLQIDWRNFEKDELLENVRIDLAEREPEHFTAKGQTGTRIVIRGLRNVWDRASIRELYRAINSLDSPFESLDSFRVLFKIDTPEWLSGLKFSDIAENALYYAEAMLRGKKIVRLDYKFTPWATMKRLSRRLVTRKHVRMVKKEIDEKTGRKRMADIDLSSAKVGDVRLKVLIFDRTAKILSLGVSNKKGLKDYLNKNGGIRVFRDGMRIYDYGEPENDWLGLDIARVNRPGVTISNNIIIGAVELDRSSSEGLVEKTNREGFVENDSYRKLCDSLLFALGKIALERNIDKSKIRKAYSSDDVGEPVVGKLALLTEKINAKLPAGCLRNELLRDIDDIEKDYQTITQVYIRSAGAGLSLGVVIHEVEKIIAEMSRVVDEKPTSPRVRYLTKHLVKLLDGYTAVLRQGSREPQDLREIIDQALFNIEFRLNAHKIEVIKQYRYRQLGSSVKCARSLVIGVLMNLIDNSIWWQNYGEIKHKKIYLDVSKNYPAHTTILMADNGPGFTIPPEEAIKPFITDKPDGMGIGLHLASEVMASHRGELIFPGKGDFSIPRDFHGGAVLGLAFKDNR